MDKARALQIIKEATETYDSIADHFSSTRFSAGPLLDKLAKNVSPESTVLDIGCGNGRLAYVIPEATNYIGVDVSKKLLNHAMRLHTKRAFKTYDGVILPITDASVDHLFMLAAFHHTPTPLQLKVLNECKRVLKKDGTITLTVWHLWRMPFLKYFVASLPGKVVSRNLDLRDIYIPWKDKHGTIIGNRYFHMFTKRKLKKLFTNAGFTIDSLETVSFLKQKNYVIKAHV